MLRTAAHAEWTGLKRALARRGASVLSSSSIYALAAFEAGCPFINFTPSPGIAVPAIQQRAKELGLPYMGSDGKTGETLVKSVLAPMFAMRHLEVMSWVGQNILGNRDGAVLDDPQTRESKIKTKDVVVSKIVGAKPVTRVGIEYVPSLDDWKVAWDFIHFRGFLNTKMSMQFTWCGSDSILAAPLIIDLTRFAALECRRGGVGPMRHLGFFFKDPMDVDEHDLFTQWRQLVEHVTAP
jgi:myo-inositol-1-phosphate synthase